MSEPTLIQRIRLRIFEHFREHAVPPVVEQLMVEFSLGRDEAAGALRELDASRHIALVPGTARVLMAFPFSAIATPFRVTAEGRTYFANCAWDAVAFHAMLDEADVTIDSACHHCAEPIHIELRAGGATVVQPSGAIVYLALKPTQWWENIVTTCANTMVFFSSTEHRDASDLCASAGPGRVSDPRRGPRAEWPHLSDEVRHRLRAPGQGRPAHPLRRAGSDRRVLAALTGRIQLANSGPSDNYELVRLAIIEHVKTTRARRQVTVVDNSHVARRIGERIREVRTRAELTQADVARGRYTAAYISALERGLAKPSMAALTFLSERLGVAITDLVAEEPAAAARLEADLLLASGDAERALDAYDTLLDRTGNDRRQQAELLRGRSEALCRLGRGRDAIRPASQAAQLFDELGSPADAAMSRYWLAFSHYQEDNPAEARGILIELLAGDRSGVSVAPDFRFRLLASLGNVEAWDGQTERALDYMEEARVARGERFDSPACRVPLGAGAPIPARGRPRSVIASRPRSPRPVSRIGCTARRSVARDQHRPRLSADGKRGSFRAAPGPSSRHRDAHSRTSDSAQTSRKQRRSWPWHVATSKAPERSPRPRSVAVAPEARTWRVSALISRSPGSHAGTRTELAQRLPTAPRPIPSTPTMPSAGAVTCSPNGRRCLLSSVTLRPPTASTRKPSAEGRASAPNARVRQRAGTAGGH